MKTTLHQRLSDLPLWRLLVALADAEREAGPSDPVVRTLARVVQERLRLEGDDRRVPATEKEVGT